MGYGVVCTWGLSQLREQEVVQLAKKCAEEPLSMEEVEIDQFQFVYSVHDPPSMSNDSITINRRQAADHQVKLAICHALAQSTKLCVYEERVIDLVMSTKHLPQHMAEHGTVRISAKEVAQLIGQVFLQRSAVNLLSSVLDTPEFFWSAPDAMQVLYERACEYLELETRVEVLNARFEVGGAHHA
ncbi:Sporulation protein RMD1 [Monoraphidium neglectum]|uniref:Sporulation protein RMD1 n=1 Tax=Monoraphidium neglectum TaxID=145388 RepID=A0A0D2IXP8_9CHLO|nr:Sporulation protein RMD1 [Monoraphidium neglectum]KIY92677.1 Sporulation protein RMD1 [Monoraphidium neglectum]|eukprot:XP_013891697.1 Sporulation protein RMD1 [Monoraphidium neglectum]